TANQLAQQSTFSPYTTLFRSSKYFSNASFVIFSPSLRTTQAIGRSCHLGSSLAITAASKTDGCAIKAFSKSTDEIHSPPLLIKSPVRSTIFITPSSSIVTTSPVYNQPSLNASSVRSSL